MFPVVRAGIGLLTGVELGHGSSNPAIFPPALVSADFERECDLDTSD